MLRIYLFIISSLLIHFLFFEGVKLVPIELKKSDSPIEVSIIDPSSEQKAADLSNKSLQIVRETTIPEENLDLSEEAKKQKAHYLSAEERRVRIESRAQLLGMTKNRFYQAKKNAEKKEERKNAQNHKKSAKWKSYDQSDFVANDSSVSEKAHRELKEVNPGFSSVGEILSDRIKFGDMTALNTDRALYYSFYARIEELIRYRWESLVESALQRVNSLKLNTANENWDTRIDIILKPDGRFANAIILKSSGISSLDSAAARAFEEAKLFPHPPPEMVENGAIRLQYMFRVYFKPKVLHVKKASVGEG